MPRRRRRLLSLGVAGCGIAALTACGGSPAADGGSSARAAVSASPSPAVKPPTKAQLKKMVVQRSDLGAGWKASPEPPTPKSDTIDPAMDKCVGIRESGGDDTINSVDSPEFRRGTVIVHSSASSIRSSSDIKSDLAPFLSPRASGCARAMIRKSMPDNEDVTADPITVTAGSGGLPGVAAAIKGSLTSSVNGTPSTVYSDQVMMTGPLAEITVNISDDGAPIPKSLERSLVATVAKRVAQR